MPQKALTWDDFPEVTPPKPTVQERHVEGEIASGAASAESSHATAVRSQALLDADRRKAIAEAFAAEQKNKTDADKVAEGKKAKDFSLTEDTNTQLENIARARKLISDGKATGAMQLLHALPTTDAKELYALMGPDGPLSANIMLKRMSEMKAASAASGGSGTGLGQQSNAEGNRLANSIVPLDPSLRAESVMHNLNAYDSYLRRMAAFARGENPDEKATAIRYGLMPPDAVQKPETSVATGATKNVPVSERKGLNGIVSAMLQQGRTAPEIKAYLNQIEPGLGDTTQNLAWYEKYYKTPEAQRPKLTTGAPSIDLESKRTNTTGFERAVGSAASNPAGAAALGSVDTFSGGMLDDLSSNPEGMRASMKAVEIQHPDAYFGGQLAGGAAQAVGMQGLAAKYGLGLGAKSLGALQGGLYGYGSSDKSGLAAIPDALLGAGTGALGGAVGNAVGKGVGTAVRGVADYVPTASGGLRPNPARYLNAQGVPMTVGEILGGGVRSAEGVASRLPFIKNLVGNRLDEGAVAYNQAGTRQSLEGLDAKYQPTSGAISDAGVQEAKAQTSKAFTDVIKPLRLKPDADYAGAVKTALAELEDIDPKAHTAIEAPLRNLLKDTTVDGSTHTVTGKDFQAALRTIQQASSSYAKASDPLYPALKPHFEALDDAFRGLVERQAPAALPKYDAAREAYRKVSILEGAVKKADANPGPTRDTPDANRAFAPNELEASGQQNATSYTGKNSGVSGSYPLEPLAKAGQDVLTPRPNPSIWQQAQLGIGVPGAVGGAAYALQPGETRDPQTGEVSGGHDISVPAILGAGTLGLMAAPYSSVARRGLQSMLLGDRSAGTTALGDMLLKYGAPALRGAGADAPAAVMASGIPDALPTPDDKSALLPSPLEAKAPEQAAPTESGHIVEVGGERYPLEPGETYDSKTDEFVAADGTRIKRSALAAVK